MDTHMELKIEEREKDREAGGKDEGRDWTAPVWPAMWDCLNLWPTEKKIMWN